MGYHVGVFSSRYLVGTSIVPRKTAAASLYSLYQLYQKEYGLVVTRSETMSSCTRCGKAMQRVFSKYGATTERKDNITKNQFASAMSSVFGNAKPLDTCYLYCASHGGVGGLGLFTGSSTMLSPEYLRSQVDSYRGTFVVLIFGCHSGTFIGRNGENAIEKEDNDDYFDASAFVDCLTAPDRSGELAGSARIKALCSCKSSQVVHYIDNETNPENACELPGMKKC